MIALTKNPIDIREILNSVRDAGAGGIDIFLGSTREASNNKKVISLEYESYEPMAVKMLEQISAEAGNRWRLKKITIVHRTGRVAVGEVSVAIAVAAAHRAESFEACRWLIDTLKKEVPIWKKEIYEDGSSWIDGPVGEGLN